MVKPLFYRTQYGVDTVLVEVHLINASQLDTLPYYYKYKQKLVILHPIRDHSNKK